MTNPWMSNFEELVASIKNKESSEMVGSRNNNLADTRQALDYERINKDDVEVIKENTKKKYLDSAIKLIEKWLDDKVFENGKYDKMDANTVKALAKYMFNNGVIFHEKGQFNLK